MVGDKTPDILKEIDYEFQYKDGVQYLVLSSASTLNKIRSESIKMVEAFLRDQVNVVGQYTDGTYTVYILRVLGMEGFYIIITKKDDPHPVPAGKWMDFPEEHWDISEQEYYQLFIQTRAEMECKEQIENWVKREFYFLKRCFWNPTSLQIET
jgi:hypothetical protein